MSSTQNLEDAVRLAIKVVCPVLLILGSFGNIVTVVVFRRLKDYSAMSTFNIALALSDLLYLYSGGLSYLWLYFQFHVDIVSVNSISCKIGVSLPVISSALSSWYLVVMTMQRAMSVMWPHRVHVVCTSNVTRVVTAVIGLVIMVSYSHLLYGISFSHDINKNLSCLFCRCDCIDAEYSYFYSHIWTSMDLIIGSFGPFVLLLVSNTVLVRALLTSVKNARHSLAVGQSMHVTARESRASSLSLTLIALSVTFFVLTGPIRVVMVAHSYGQRIVKSVSIELILLVMYTLVTTNSVLNFYLYFLTGTKFRKETVQLMKDLFKWKSVKNVQN